MSLTSLPLLFCLVLQVFYRKKTEKTTQIIKFATVSPIGKKYYAAKLFLKSRPNVPYFRDITTRATGTTEIAPKFSDTFTLLQPGGGGHILPTIPEIAPIIFPWIHL